MHRIFRVKAYEKEHGPHFNEEYARKAVMKMENEDGTRGPHWSLEETTTLASQYGIALGSKFNRYDWFVALNMVYSDYYRVIKQEIVNILRNQYNTYKARKESIAKCDEEMSKCQALLEKLDIPKEPTNTEDPRIKELQDEVNELKNIIKQASSMVPPPMKQMLPQNMQNVMKEVDQ